MNKNTPHTIDDKVRQVLTDLEALYQADHWQKMTQQLDALDAADADFDKMVFQELGQYKVPFEPKHWSDMAERLDHLDKTEASFDTFMKKQLDNVSPNPNSAHWSRMANQLDDTFSWRAKILRSKVIEAALMLLVLFTIINTFGLPFETGTATKGEKTTANSATETRQKGKAIVPTTKANPTKPAARSSESNIGKTFQTTRDSRLPSAQPPQNVLDMNKNLPAQQNQNNLIPSLSKPVAMVDKPMPSSETNNTPIGQEAENASEKRVDASSDIAETAIKQEAHRAAALAELPLRKIKTIGSLENGEVVASADYSETLAAAFEPLEIRQPNLLNTKNGAGKIDVPKAKEAKAKWRFSLFGIASADVATMNYLVNREAKTQNKASFNDGFGAGVSYRRGRWELETGAQYSEKTFNLPNVKVTTGTFLRGFTEESPQNLRLSILSIPLNLQFAAKETRRWRFTAFLGTNLNMLFRSAEKTVIKSSDFNSLANAPDPKPIDPSTYEPNIYPKGIGEKGFFKELEWLRGGLKENTYLTAQVGLGVEYRVSPNTSLYVQPNFEKQYGRGIGTLGDRFQALSIRGGFKTSLK